jgi:putative membrane-bound dehydrogenase-like protein
VLVLLLVLCGQGLAEDLGLRIAPGFRVTLYADQDLANDIFAMTLDSQGRVVVTGPGYIKVLHDTKGTGKADKATLFATPRTGGMGMCFDDDDLYFCGGGWFSRYRDRAGKGAADGPPEQIIPLAFSEHGGHAMRKGPDGWWYIIGGNDSVFGPQHVTLPHSPIRKVEGGALLRLTPDCRQCEVIAHGFRNPYDFDFNELGDLFTYDSDCERDFFLPWYTPTRIYHIAQGGHHGWRLAGYLRSWCRKDYYLDTVDILWPVGRGSPTGVTCYRHRQFPDHYRGGLFALDWTFGKVYFFPLEPEGSSYRTQPEVFLEAVGTSGFDPTDIVVAPDGSLFICQGGRGTRGAVYRVEYVREGRKLDAAPTSELDAVLYAPQPLDAWSRARWEPLAKKLGREPFQGALEDEKRDVAGRIRALEIITEFFGGLAAETAQRLAQCSSPTIRSRLAWSLGRVPCKDFEEVLYRLAKDPHARVRRCALEALGDRFAEWKPRGDERELVSAVGSDKRVRQVAARWLALTQQQALAETRDSGAESSSADSPDVQVTKLLAACSGLPQKLLQEHVLTRARSVLEHTANNEVRLQVIRLIMLVLGDYSLHNPPIEVYTAYSLPTPVPQELPLRPILQEVRRTFPSGDSRLDEETSRLLAMLEDDGPASVHKVAAFWTKKSSPTRDMHYLVVFSRLRGSRDPVLTRQVANALLGLHRKLEGREQRTKQTWHERLAEVTAQLIRRDPPLADELLRHPDFVSGGHVELAATLDAQHRRQAAELFLKAVQKDPDFLWSGPLIDLLEELPAAKVHPVLHAQWSNYGLRDAILMQLVKQPEGIDREKYLVGLESTQPQIVRGCLTALESLPRNEAPKNLVPVLRLLRRLEQEPKEAAVRRQVLALINRQTEQAFQIQEKDTQAAALKRTYAPLFRWFEERHPALAGALNELGDEDPAIWNKLLQAVDWSKGNPAKGEALFRERACQTCHMGARALGPDLTGVTSRFSREDLFTAIIYPSRDVAPAYRTTSFETRKGQVVTGIVAFESADGVILQTGASTTVRLGTDEIVSHFPSNRSLMPNGLLKGTKPADLADLYSYLRTLKNKPPGGNSLK